MVRSAAVAKLDELQVVVDAVFVNVVEVRHHAVGALEGLLRWLPVILLHDELGVLVGFPMPVEAQIDAASATLDDLIVRWVLRPEQIFGTQSLLQVGTTGLFEAFVGKVIPIEATERVFEAELGGELDKVVKGIHPAQIHKPMFAPQDQRHLVAHRDLDRHGENAAVAMPVHVALQLEPDPIHLLQNFDAWTNDDMIAIENLTHPVEVILAFGKIVIAVIGDEQCLEPKFLHRDMRLKVTVLSATDRDEDVVVVRRAVLIGQFLEQFPAPRPVNGGLGGIHPAPGADAIFIEGQGCR